MKTILTVEPDLSPPAKGRPPPPPAFWPDGPVVVQFQRVRVGRQRPKRGQRRVRYVYALMVSGYSTVIEWTPETIVPADLGELRRYLQEWRALFPGRWRFTLRTDRGLHAKLTPWTKRLDYDVPT